LLWEQEVAGSNPATPTIETVRNWPCSACAFAALSLLGACRHGRPATPEVCRARYQVEHDQPTQYQACVFRFEDYEARRREREQRRQPASAACPRGATVSVHMGNVVTTYEGALACTPAHGGLFCMPEADGGVDSAHDAGAAGP
jgi:hypothetical protein